MTIFHSNPEIQAKQKLLEKAIANEDWKTGLPLAQALSFYCVDDCLSLAFIYQKINDAVGADLAINFARSKWPESTMPIIWMATNHFDRGQYDLAYSTLTEITPGDDQIGFLYYSLESIIFSSVKDYESALAAGLKASSLAPDAERKESIECRIAMLYYNLCSPELSIHKLFSTIKINPASVEALSSLIAVLSSDRKWEKLLTLLRKVRELDRSLAFTNQIILRAEITCFLELRGYKDASNAIMELATCAGDDDPFVMAFRQRLIIANQQYLQNINNLNLTIKK